MYLLWTELSFSDSLAAWDVKVSYIARKICRPFVAYGNLAQLAT